MKTYVFLTRRICGIGGAEQYIYNKVKYLESQGWRVLVFSGRHGKILIHEFEKFVPLIIPTLEWCPECFSKKEVQKVLHQITEKIGDCNGDVCIIESNSVIRAVWAELVAERLNARHLAFVLQEKHVYRADMKQFLRFKYNRHELAGITNISVKQMLADDQLEMRNDTRISAYCNNVIEDCDDRYSSQLDENADYTFASIGRLEKPCVLPIVLGFRDYFQNHSSQRFNLVMIGGSPTRVKEDRIREALNECDNINLVFTGNVYPIPRSFIEKVDVFVSTAGAANATYRAGRPTVRVHPVTGEPVGIIGLDFDLKEKSMYESTSDITIENCIDRAIKNAGAIIYNSNFDHEYYDQMKAEFNRQISFVDHMATKEYYENNLLRQLKTPGLRHHYLYWIIGHLVGGVGQEKLRMIKMRHKNHE